MATKTQTITIAAAVAVLCACADKQSQRTVDDTTAQVDPPAQLIEPALEEETASAGKSVQSEPQRPIKGSDNSKVREIAAAKQMPKLTTEMARELAAPDMHSMDAAAAYHARPMASMAMKMSAPHGYTVDRENYIHYDENGVKRVLEDPVSTFSIDVDTAAYANVRRMLVREGRLPPSDAVRLEEMINYFSYSYEAPRNSEQPFSIHTEFAPAPWSDSHHLLQVGLKGFEPPAAERPDANLVFLVDVSGSMRDPNKLGLVKKAVRLLVNNMTAGDRIALAVYAGAAGTVLESTPGNEKAKILQAIDGLEAGGSTHGSAGIKLAYALAEQYWIEDGINRVIIASDGDMNVGTVNIEALKDLIERKREGGIALTTLGFGAGNYNYALMEQLADVGNGNAAYIDSLKEAQKVLVNEMQSTLFTIASDVKIQVEFNPAEVSEYRLIGYENRLLGREDFNNDKVDAGDIGAGHTVTALYEVVLAGSGGERIPGLRYQREAAPGAARRGELAHVKLRYKTPGEKDSQLLTRVVRADSGTGRSSDDLRFAASVAGFGQLLQGGTFTGDWGYDDALELARRSRGDDPHGYRGEFIHLIELARSLSSKS
ncbi:MAG: VWA domain-containing protein [Halioglobus sp.]|nr:VWA domain-containing protein [Halioglobus sp.]